MGKIKADILQVRVSAELKERIRQVVQGLGISESEYVRVRMGEATMRDIAALSKNENTATIGYAPI